MNADGEHSLTQFDYLKMLRDGKILTTATSLKNDFPEEDALRVFRCSQAEEEDIGKIICIW